MYLCVFKSQSQFSINVTTTTYDTLNDDVLIRGGRGRGKADA